MKNKIGLRGYKTVIKVKKKNYLGKIYLTVWVMLEHAKFESQSLQSFQKFYTPCYFCQ